MDLQYLISLLTRTKMCVSSISNSELIKELEAVIKHLKNI